MRGKEDRRREVRDDDNILKTSERQETRGERQETEMRDERQETGDGRQETGRFC